MAKRCHVTFSFCFEGGDAFKSGFGHLNREYVLINHHVTVMRRFQFRFRNVSLPATQQNTTSHLLSGLFLLTCWMTRLPLSHGLPFKIRPITITIPQRRPATRPGCRIIQAAGLLVSIGSPLIISCLRCQNSERSLHSCMHDRLKFGFPKVISLPPNFKCTIVLTTSYERSEHAVIQHITFLMRSATYPYICPQI